MTRQHLSLVVVFALTLSACSHPPIESLKTRFGRPPAPVITAPVTPQLTPPVQTVAFVVGESSNTVEQIAKKNSCASSKGAGLVTPVGLMEIYRVGCDDGRVLLARCEVRQCVLTSIK